MVSSFLVADVDKENDGFVSCDCDEGGEPKENDGFEALSLDFELGVPKENADLLPESVDGC